MTILSVTWHAPPLQGCHCHECHVRKKIWGRKGVLARTCNLRAQQNGGWGILNRDGKPKMEIPGKEPIGRRLQER